MVLNEAATSESAPPSVSVAIPLYNEADGVQVLLDRVLAVLDQLPGDGHEVVLVDDGSTDATFQLLRRAAEKDERVVAISLSRNFGHQAACAAALRHTRGQVGVLMDGDLQDPPEQIPEMLKRYHEGFDVVYAIRAKRKEGVLLRSCYFLFYRVMGALADQPMPLDAGDFCLMSRRVIDFLNASGERQRYLRGLRAWVGFRQVGIPIEREARQHGDSKYSWRGLLGLAVDGIFSHSVLPLRAAALLGFVAILVSLLIAAHALYGKLVQGDSPQGYTALVITLIFFSGVQLVFLGVIGEYVGRIFEEVKRRPSFIVDQVIRADDACNPTTPSSTADSTTNIGGGEVENR
ncbi:glycosyltransferase family 2 protein [Roseiconus nitratireducens]|uniref:Glycosyltransferase family 2 protein n=1 Tax=Roseiconus nitratireducens TaxID=2605748 RepID=A0A5M6DBD9_9BACT|nr:glycosyltransferase family 2 protein [Roseiconus nitratireducens]KAA5543632.1 glycosyltransferase family 2 protein [Roseiconus nitratireducens]